MKTTLSLYAILVLALLTIIGCGHFDSPTASQPTVNDETPMWNPQLGDQLNGHEIPLVSGTYWESVFGANVNPWLIAPRPVVIGPAGGIIQIGLHKLIVPAGAVDHDVEFTISNASVTGIALDCSPSPFHFDRPLTLVMSYVGTQYATNLASGAGDLCVYYMTPDGHLEAQRCTVNLLNLTVSAEIDHFSRYILG